MRRLIIRYVLTRNLTAVLRIVHKAEHIIACRVGSAEHPERRAVVCREYKLLAPVSEQIAGNTCV